MKMKHFLAPVLLAGLVLSGCSRHPNMSAQDHLRKAQQLIQAGNYQSAYMELAEALHQSPQDPQIHLNLGWLYLYTDEAAKAQAELQKLTEMQPDMASTFHLRGALYNHLQQYEDAMKNYRQAEALKSDNPRLYFDMAETQANMNRNTEAVTSLNKGLAMLSKDDTDSRLNFLFSLCTAQSRLKHFKEAIETCNQAIAISPSEEERARMSDFVHNMQLIELIESPGPVTTASEADSAP